MEKVGIIGLGHVGSTLAYSLVVSGTVDELVLFEQNEKLASAELYDLVDAQTPLATKTKITIQAVEKLAELDILVFCPGKISILTDANGRFSELKLTSQMVKEWAPQIKQSGFKGILIVITNPCDVITTYMQKLTGLPSQRVIGTGTLLDTARMKQTVALDLAVDAQVVEGYVYGEHGESQVVAWSTVTIDGRPITDLYTPQELANLKEVVRLRSWQIFYVKHYTCYGIASCTTDLIRLIFTDAHALVPISAYDAKEDLYYGRPAIIGKNGVERVVNAALSDLEQEQLLQSIAVIRGNLAKLAVNDS
ncbi:MAG: lactate/malate family dehydrogenase [Enterococcus sp.]